MDYISHNTFLSPEKLAELLHLLSLNTQKWSKSKVYDTKNEENIVNISARSSKRIRYTQPELFEWVNDNIVDKLDTMVEESNFTLLHNDLEVIMYQPGDFFSKHQDFEVVQSDEYRNWTFLICLNACQEGGETVIHNGETKYTIQTTSKHPGGLLTFPKEAFHEGLPVVEGTKMILMGNLLQYQKERKDRLLVVNLLQNPGKSYVLPFKLVMQCPTSSYAAFIEFQDSLGEEKQVLYYNEPELDHVEFAEYYKRLTVTADKLIDINMSLDYLGMPVDNCFFQFNRFLNDDSLTYFTCPIADYYNLLQVDFPKEILPFQVVCIEEFCIWFGFYDNLFAAVDIVLDGDSTKEFSLETFNIEDKDSMIRCEISQYNSLRDLHNILETEEWWNTYCPGTTVDLWEKYHVDWQNIFAYHGLKSIREMVPWSDGSKSDCENMMDYITNIVDELIELERQFGFENDIRKESSVDSPVKLDIEKDLSHLKGIDIEKLYEWISSKGKYKQRVVKSYAYHCNQTEYATIKTNIKFGFVKINDFDQFKYDEDIKYSSEDSVDL